LANGGNIKRKAILRHTSRHTSPNHYSPYGTLPTAASPIRYSRMRRASFGIYYSKLPAGSGTLQQPSIPAYLPTYIQPHHSYCAYIRGNLRQPSISAAFSGLQRIPPRTSILSPYATAFFGGHFGIKQSHNHTIAPLHHCTIAPICIILHPAPAYIRQTFRYTSQSLFSAQYTLLLRPNTPNQS